MAVRSNNLGKFTKPAAQVAAVKNRNKAKCKIQRAKQNLVLANAPPVRKAKVKKRHFLQALTGTGGIRKRILKNLKVVYPRKKITLHTVDTLLERPDWEDVRKAYIREVESVADDAEETIHHAITQRLDLPTAANTAKWYLSRIRKEKYGDTKSSTLTVQGGDSPIRTTNVQINLDSLNLPIEVQRQVLEALETQERLANTKQVEARQLPNPNEESDD